MTQPPNDEFAEKSLLGAILTSPKSIPKIIDTISHDSYYLPKHQLIHAAIIEMFTRGDAIDPVTVGAELESRGQATRTGGAHYLVDLIQTVPLVQNAPEYAAVIAEKSRLRRLAELGVQLQQLAYTDGYESAEVYAKATKLIRNMSEPESSGTTKFDELIEQWKLWDDDNSDCIPTPWWEVNDWLNGGLAKGRLVTIGGRPSVGKSLGGLNIAAHAAENGHPAIFFSLEMSRQEVTTRILACGGDVEMRQLLRRKLEADSLGRIDSYTHKYSAMPLWVDDREKLTVEQIAARCRTIPNLEVAVVDYLQLVTASDSRVSREQQVAHISRSLKIMARELGIAVVVAAQLNRGPVKDGKPRDPTIADLRESGAVEQDSDQVLLLHRPDDDEAAVRMICGKNRVGRTGSVDLHFEGRYARLSSSDEEKDCMEQMGYMPDGFFSN
jgi:replicative DNA helicase